MVLGNKRGMTDSQFYFIVEMLAAVIIFLAMLTYIGGVATDSLFEQNFMARDVALMIDSVYASPGEIRMNYDTSVKLFAFPYLNFYKSSNFSFAFEESRVYVSSAGDSSSLYSKPVIYYFGKDNLLNLALDDGINAAKIEKLSSGEIKHTNQQANVIIENKEGKVSISTEKENE